MPELPCMNEAQFRKAKKLIRKLCANCDDGNCLLLEDGEVCVCPPAHILHVAVCMYFRAAVLPTEAELYAEVMHSDGQKCCAECGKPFTRRIQNTLYCAACAAKRTKRKKREWAARNRGRQ
jgi:hypothetical protein